MKSLLFVGLQLVLYGTAVGLIRKYFYNSQQTNLITAEIYCRMNHGHLAHITSEEEFQRALVVAPSLSWIGLYRTPRQVNTWQWSNGKITTFTKWSSGEPNHGQGEDCVVMDSDGWRDTTCPDGTFTSICSKNFTLVKEKKTWEEALQHCKTRYTDLAYLDSEIVIEVFGTQLKLETQTGSVWTGLRFFAGEWFWVNGEPIKRPESLPPQCPSRPNHCGSYNVSTSFWENRDCNETFNFVCYD